MGDTRRQVARELLVLAGMVLVTGLPSLFTRDLWNPDEPRYMEVAREMVLLRDYVLPRLNGEIYSEKPPLFFWLAGLLWKAGMGYNAGRVLTLLCVFGTLALLYALARKHIAPEAAPLAALATLSTVLMFYFVRRGVLDPLLTFLCTASLACGYQALQKEARHRAIYWIGSYGAMALGTLTKGPVGFIVPGLVLLAFAIINHKNLRAGGACHAAGLAVFAAIVLAWLLPAIAAGGSEYARTILVKQQVGRAVESYSHRNPFYYYIVGAPAYLFPWSLLVPLALVAAAQRWRRAREGLPLFATLWLVVPTVFFSFISGKRVNYVLPTVPGLGLLCGWYVHCGHMGWKARAWASRLISAPLAILLVLIVGGAAAVCLAPRLAEALAVDEDVGGALTAASRPAMTAAAIIALAVPLGACALGLLRRARPLPWRASVLGAAILLLTPPIDLVFTPVTNQFKSGRSFAQEVRRRAGDTKQVYIYGNELSGVYNLYSGYLRMPVVTAPEELAALLEKPDTFVIGPDKALKKALPGPQYERHVAFVERVGHREMILLRGGEASP